MSAKDSRSFDSPDDTLSGDTDRASKDRASKDTTSKDQAPRGIVDFARAWLEVDPDPKTSGELQVLLNGVSDFALDLGSAPDSLKELTELFEGHLSFGTAGLRAALGAGPQRMNRVLVQLVTKALVKTLVKSSGNDSHPRIVVGYDARHNSDIFARDACGMIEDLGGEALLIDAPLPTPVLAYGVLKKSGNAGVMVTASHNPRQDNGYKAYWSDGAQIAPPNDSLVEQEFGKLLADYSNLRVKDYASIKTNTDVADEVVAGYVDCLAQHLAPEVPVSKNLKLVYTPLHGVGKGVMEKVFSRLDFPKPLVVAEQGEPDGDFPTAAYPNPEEAGALDLALELAQTSGADLLLANDPDADRLSVSLPTDDSGWRTLTGNELGVLLADYCMEHNSGKHTSIEDGGKPQPQLVATTCVSSQLLGSMAKARGIQYVETLTGFKWIARADAKTDAKFIFGYEEALGYSVLPTHIRDKDGISAAVAFVNLYSQLKAQGKTPLDRLTELDEEHGMHLTSAASIRYDGSGSGQVATAAAVMARIRTELPTHIGNIEVANVVDYSGGTRQRPANMISFYLENESRVVVRPSGTEPKLKVYVELVEKDLSQRAKAKVSLDALTASAAKMVAGSEDI